MSSPENVPTHSPTTKVEPDVFVFHLAIFADFKENPKKKKKKKDDTLNSLRIKNLHKKWKNEKNKNIPG